MSKYVTVDVNTNVSLNLDDILEGLDEEDLKSLIERASKEVSGRTSASAKVADRQMEDAILRRHYAEHVTGLGPCIDPICAAWEERR